MNTTSDGATTMQTSHTAINRVLFEVEAQSPRDLRARKSLVRNWVVLASDHEEAIARVIDEQVTAILGDDVAEEEKAHAARRLRAHEELAKSAKSPPVGV